MLVRTFVLMVMTATLGVGCGDAGVTPPIVNDDLRLTAPDGVASQWNHGALKCAVRFEDNGTWQELPLIESSRNPSEGIRYEANYDVIHFQVNYNELLNTLYTFMESGGVQHFFATLRIPTQNHNDSVGIINAEGKRWILSCAFE